MGETMRPVAPIRGTLFFIHHVPHKAGEEFTIDVKLRSMFRPAMLLVDPQTVPLHAIRVVSLVHVRGGTPLLETRPLAASISMNNFMPFVGGESLRLTLRAEHAIRGFWGRLEGAAVLAPGTTNDRIDVTDYGPALPVTDPPLPLGMPRVEPIAPEEVVSVGAPTLAEAAEGALRFLGTMNLQDHSTAEQREHLIVVRRLTRALELERKSVPRAAAKLGNLVTSIRTGLR